MHNLETSPASTDRRQVEIEELAGYLRTHDDYLIVSHVRPDGDCLGSTVALYLGLKALGKRVHAYNPSPVPEKFDFMEGIEVVRQQLPDAPIGTTLFVDCGGPSRVTPGFTPIGVAINIDHHATNEMFGAMNYVDVDATSVGEQVYDLLGELGVEVDRAMATAIYTSMASDSGSFRYPNTCARTFDVAADLTRRGAVPAMICQKIYESRSREEMLLTGRIYARIRYECSDRLIWSELLDADYREVGGEDHEPEGVVSDLRCVDGVEVSILFHELPDGGMRAGIRGKGRVDCAWIAKQMGGGGHTNASGLFRPGGSYPELRDQLLAIARGRLEVDLGPTVVPATKT